MSVTIKWNCLMHHNKYNVISSIKAQHICTVIQNGCTSLIQLCVLQILRNIYKYMSRFCGFHVNDLNISCLNHNKIFSRISLQYKFCAFYFSYKFIPSMLMHASNNICISHVDKALIVVEIEISV